MTYRVAEKFKSIQGEGQYAGTPMAFIRFVGCSVGKKICQHCDTDFDNTMPWRGGGEFTAGELLDWAAPYKHICLTGGEPLDQELHHLFFPSRDSSGLSYPAPDLFHIETSGTKFPSEWPPSLRDGHPTKRVWLCVSPKPGWDSSMIELADEIKVIVPGLGTPESLHALTKADGHLLSQLESFRWPDLKDALRWEKEGKLVYLQPRNGKFEVDRMNLLYVTDLLRDHPSLRLSAQLHKILKVQ
jgi:organic radical activating enzyme